MKAERKYFWIIGGGLLQVPLIEEARKLDLSIIVSDGSNQCICKELSDIFLNIDIFNIDGHLEQANKLISRGVNIAGVLAAGIDAPETMANLAMHLNLLTVDLEIAKTVHRKHIFREKLKKLGYPVPKFISVSNEDIDNLDTAIESIGFPLIVKNTDSSGSRGTKIFRSKNLAEIKNVIKEAIAVSKSKRALIEECWEGQEITVETLFDIYGNFHPCFITDRIFDRSNGYAIELGLRHPTVLSETMQSEVYNIAENVARDLGIKIGAAKYDMMITNSGPRIIEMTCRLSGGFDCQYLVPATTGKNVMRAAILIALGENFTDELLIDTKRKVGLTSSLWPVPGKITKILGVDEAKKINGVENIFFRYKIGEVIPPYTDCTKRVCFIIVTGTNEHEAKSIMRRAKNTIKIVTE